MNNKLLTFLFLMASKFAFAGPVQECTQVAAEVNKSTPMRLDALTVLKNASCVAILGGAKLIYANQIDTSTQKITQRELSTLLPGQKNYWCVNPDGKALIALYDIEYTYSDMQGVLIGKTNISRKDCR
jgi:hypothetical protein